MIPDPHPDLGQYLNLTTSRGSPLAHACHVWSTSLNVFVSYPAHKQNDRQTMPVKLHTTLVLLTRGAFYFFATRDIARNLQWSKRWLSRNILQKLCYHGTLSTVTFINKHKACLLLLFLRVHIIKYNYNIIHINTEFVQKHKQFPSPLTPRCGRS